MSPLVCIGVPVYRGQAYLEETLRSIAKQTHRDIAVTISLDGPDPACEEIASRFTSDERFKVVVQEQRLGWARNISWLMANAKGDFWYYHQQDDLVAENYVEALLEGFAQQRRASVVYCDIAAFGTHEGLIAQASVTGETAFERHVTLLRDHFNAVAFRGLVRVETLRCAGAITTNEHEDFACDTVWMASAALTGDLIRVPLVLYRKRYHATSTHLAWAGWPADVRHKAWAVHCAQMVEQALRIDTGPQQSRELWRHGVERLLSQTTAYVPISELAQPQRDLMRDGFLTTLMRSQLCSPEKSLRLSWCDIEEATQRWYRDVEQRLRGLGATEAKNVFGRLVSGLRRIRS